MNIKQALEYGIELLKENNIDEPILKTRIILSNILNKTKEYLMVHELEELDKDLVKKFKEDISKLCEHIPIQYITNKQEFMGLEFYVDENVLIPQPDTEILVEEVIDIAKKEKKTKILDFSRYALDVASKNTKKFVGAAISRPQNNDKGYMNYEIKIIQSDLFENIKDKFDIIVSNPPYIKSDVIKTLDKEVQNEPILALDGGRDGLRYL